MVQTLMLVTAASRWTQACDLPACLTLGFISTLWRAVSYFSRHECLPRRVLFLKNGITKTDDRFLKFAWIQKPEANGRADRIVYK